MAFPYRYQNTDIVGASELMGPRAGTNGLMVYQPHTGGALDDLKLWLEKRSVANIPNKYLVAGAALAGLAYYGHTQRWF